MTKKSRGPSLPSTSAALPTTGRSSAPVIPKTWKTMTPRTAIARSESKRAKRGLPGGGVSAGDVAGSALSGVTVMF